MINIDEIRRRAEYHQGEEPLGSAMYVLSQDVLALLDAMNSARCGPKDVPDDNGQELFHTTQLIAFLRELAGFQAVATYRRKELTQAADRLEGMYKSYLEVCPHEKERDEARELHAKVCAQYAEAVSRLNSIHTACEMFRRTHSQGAAEREGIASYSIACGNVEESLVAMIGMIDCGVCGDVHREPACVDHPKEVVS